MICLKCNCHTSTSNCKLCGEGEAREKKLYKIPRESAKRAKENREYLKMRKEFLAINTICPLCKKDAATQVHHKKGRIGKLLTNPEFWLAICTKCHEKITVNSKEAIEQGYSLKRNGKI